MSRGHQILFAFGLFIAVSFVSNFLSVMSGEGSFKHMHIIGQFAYAAGPVKVVDTGAIPNDDKDDTNAIFAAALRAKCLGVDVYFPAGNYIFQIKDDPRAREGDHQKQVWELRRDYTVSNRGFVSLKEMLGGSFQCASDEIIGVQHNIFEFKVNDLVQDSVRPLKPTMGDFKRPPLAEKMPNSPVTMIAHWWSRFGSRVLQSQGRCAWYNAWQAEWSPKCKMDNGSYGSIYGTSDYTWEWGHKSGPRVDTSITKNGRTEIVRTDSVSGLQLDYPAAYDQGRHPLLGWYREDDPIVLDWITYWLVKYGVEGVTLAHGEWVDKKLFGTDSKGNELVPNFKKLKYVLWANTDILGSSRYSIGKCFAGDGEPGCAADSAAQLYNSWKNLLETKYFNPKFNNHLLVAKNGRTYPVVYVFKGAGLRQTLGSFPRKCRLNETNKIYASGNICWEACANDSCGVEQTKDFLVRIAGLFKEKGFPGFALLARNSENLLDRSLLKDNGVLYVEANYAGIELLSSADKTNLSSYQAISKSLMATYSSSDFSNSLIAVPTAAWSKPPHYSKWPWKDSNPELFGQWLNNVGTTLLKRKEDREALPFYKPLMAIYNVSEWLEAGSSLQPNMKYGFAYLQKVKLLSEKLFNTPVHLSDFEKGTDVNWTLYKKETLATGTIVSEQPPSGNYNYRINIGNTGELNQNIQFFTTNIQIEKNQKYRLRFYAKSSVNKDIVVKLMKQQSPWISFGLDRVVSVSSSWTQYNLDFTSSHTASDARIDFFLGGENINNFIIDIDRVVLRRLM